MSLLDAQPPKPSNHVAKSVVLLAILVMIIGGLLAFRMWNYPEERAVTAFFATLQQGDYQKAYKLWKPARSYSFDDFMHDWGPQGDYGRVQAFQIVLARSKGPQTVIVTVRVNNQDPPLDLLVDRKTKSLAYSIF